MILVIDNYDSFVYNLARYVSELGYEKKVVRHDAISLAECRALNPSHIIISPGPRTPDDAGISLSIIEHFAGVVPILGVCLGHQAIGQAFGGRVVRAQCPMHGKSSFISHDGTGVFANLPNPLKVGRYHSLVVEPDSLPDCLVVTARSAEGEIMGLAHRTLPVIGVQFHPESVLTQGGYEMLKNFLSLTVSVNEILEQGREALRS